MTECSDGEKYLKSLQQGNNRFPDCCEWHVACHVAEEHKRVMEKIRK